MRSALAVLILTASAGRADVTWRAPAGCPTAADVRTRIEQRLGAPLEIGAVEVTVRRLDGRYVARLDMRGITVANEIRTLSSTRCEALADAVAVVIARLAGASPVTEPGGGRAGSAPPRRGSPRATVNGARYASRALPAPVPRSAADAARRGAPPATAAATPRDSRRALPAPVPRAAGDAARRGLPLATAATRRAGGPDSAPRATSVASPPVHAGCGSVEVAPRPVAEPRRVPHPRACPPAIPEDATRTGEGGEVGGNGAIKGELVARARLPRGAPVAPRRWGYGVHALALSGVGTVPRVGVGGELSLFARRERSFVSLGVARWASRSDALVMGGPGDVEVGLDLVTARIGWAPGHMPLRAWLGSELGAMQGQGDTALAPARWFAVTSGVSVGWPMTPYARLVGTFEIAVPTSRIDVGYGTTASAAARCAFGLELGPP